MVMVAIEVAGSPTKKIWSFADRMLGDAPATMSIRAVVRREGDAVVEYFEL